MSRSIDFIKTRAIRPMTRQALFDCGMVPDYRNRMLYMAVRRKVWDGEEVEEVLRPFADLVDHISMEGEEVLHRLNRWRDDDDAPFPKEVLPFEHPIDDFIAAAKHFLACVEQRDLRFCQMHEGTLTVPGFKNLEEAELVLRNMIEDYEALKAKGITHGFLYNIY